MANGGVARISSLDESGISGVQDLEINSVTRGQGYIWAIHAMVVQQEVQRLWSQIDLPSNLSYTAYELGDPRQVTLLLRVSYIFIVKWG